MQERGSIGAGTVSVFREKSGGIIQMNLHKYKWHKVIRFNLLFEHLLLVWGLRLFSILPLSAWLTHNSLDFVKYGLYFKRKAISKRFDALGPSLP